MHRLRFFVAAVLISAEAATLPSRTVDRTLYIRSIPEVQGYNSHIYEVLMTPFATPREERALSSAMAMLRSAADARVGQVTVQETATGQLKLSLSAEGLQSGAKLGLSIHDDGDCRRLGPVFKPDQPANAVPSPDTPAGYLGTFSVDDQGKLEMELELGPRLALSGHRSILARGVGLHEMSDKPDGASSLVACGVVGRVSSQQRRRRHFFH